MRVTAISRAQFPLSIERLGALDLTPGSLTRSPGSKKEDFDRNVVDDCRLESS